MLPAELIDRLAADRTPRSYRFALAALLFALAGVITLLAWTGCSFQTDMGWDALIMLEAAARWEQGQIPHVDYLSPIGVFPTWVMAAALKISAGTADALAYAPALLAAPVTGCAWWLARRRFGAWIALVFSLAVLALVTAARPLPYGMLAYKLEFAHLSYAMSYNRLGWALLGLLALHCFLPPLAGESPRSSLAENFLAGVICVLLLLTKVNYAAAALGVVLVSAVLLPRSRQAWLALATGAGLTLALATIALRFHPGAYLGELALLGRINPIASRVPRAVELILGNISALVLVGAACVILLPLFRLRTQREQTRPWIFPAGLTLALGACGLAVLTLNTQLGEVPLFALTVLVLAEHGARRLGTRDRSEHALRLRHRTALGIAALLGLVTLASDAASVVWSAGRVRHARASIPEGQLLQSPLLSRYLLPPQAFEEAAPDQVTRTVQAVGAPLTPYQYGLVLNDGLALLAPHTDGRSRIMTFDLANPFPLARGSRYPRGGSLWWAYNTFSTTVHPRAEDLFRDVTHLMIPKAPVLRDGEAAALRDIYRAELQANFTRAAESTFWILLRRQ